MTAPEGTIYVLDVGGAPILTFAAKTFREAQSLRHERWLRTDLVEAHSNGTPVWDGKAKLKVRRANDEEQARFSEGMTSVVDDSGDLLLVYLVALDR